MNTTQISVANSKDLRSIINLLNHYKLMTEDIDLDKQLFIKFEKKYTLIAIGGLELYPPFALLRSIAVDPAFARRGYAKQICTRLYQLALAKGISELYLLTETAEGYFLKLGFQNTGRDDVPAIIKNTNQFRSLCCAEATVMRKPL